MDAPRLAAGLAPRFSTGASAACRLLYDPPGDGAWNMAVDEVLLDNAVQTGQATLRFYGWREPTISLGYFQSWADGQAWATHPDHRSGSGRPLVRRPTGGGAIIHDAELTYSLTVPAGGSRWPTGAALYALMHGSLVEVLRRFGIAAREHCGKNCEAAQTLPAPQPFLCFERRAGGDVICRDMKIAGSAQRRHRGAVLQHGSVLLRASACAPHLAGLADLSGVELSAAELAPAWVDCLQKRLDVRIERPPLESRFQEAAAQLARDKYATEAWNRRR